MGVFIFLEILVDIKLVLVLILGEIVFFLIRIFIWGLSNVFLLVFLGIIYFFYIIFFVFRGGIVNIFFGIILWGLIKWFFLVIICYR